MLPSAEHRQVRVARFVTLSKHIAPASAPSPAERARSAMLFARAALHAAQPERALRALDDVAMLLDADDDRTTATILRGAALCALGRADDGTVLLRQAAGAGDGTQHAEAVFELAHAYRHAGRLDDAAAVLAPLVDAAPDAGAEPLVARALALYGHVEIERGRRPMAARHYLDALRIARSASEADAPLRASLLHGLAAVAVDTLDLRLFARVRREVDGAAPSDPVRRSPRLDEARVHGELLGGDTGRAWTIAFEALRTAPAGVAAAAALVRAAAVSHAAGETFTRDRLALAAADVSRDADWAAVARDDRRTLLAVVTATAAADLGAARALLALYERAVATDAGHGGGNRADTRVAELLAQAAVAAAAGQAAERARALHAARTSAREAGNHYAELTALLALLAAGGDAGTLRRADELTGLVPGSWLRRRFELLAERARGPVLLNPAERRVMSAICEGLSTAQIAERFGRSKNTIRNQTRRVYEVMGVHTRSALVATCAAMGVIPGKASSGSSG